MNEDRLRRHLADKAAGVDATPADPANLKARSANPLLVMAGGLALVALFGAGLAWLLPAADDDADIAVETTATTIARAGEQGSSSSTHHSIVSSGVGSDLPALTAGDGPTLTWQRGQLPEGALANGIIPYGDGFLAWGQELSTLEEGSTPQLKLWRSSDGMEWTAVEADGLAVDGDFWVNTMLATEQRLIAVGVAYDTADPEAMEGYYRPANERTIMLTSADGVSWSSTEFPVQASGTTANPGEYWSSGQPLLAARGDLVVLLTTQTLSFDPYVLIAESLGEDAPEIGGMSWGPDAIEVMGVDGNEVIARFTLEELGIDPAYLENSGGAIETRSSVLVSIDGGVTFEARDTSGLEDIGYASSMVATIDGFIVIGEQIWREQFPGGQAAWRSADGVGWVMGEPLADGWLNTLDSSGSFVVGAGENLIVSFDSGASFNRVEGAAFDPVADLQFSVEQAKTGAFGTFAVGSSWQPGPPPPPLEVEVDGLIYREVYGTGFDSSGPTVTVTDAASGEVVFSKDNFWQAEHITYDSDGGGAVTFNSPETGEPIMTVNWSELGLGDVGRLGGAESATIERDGLNLTAELGDQGIGRVVITDVASGEVIFDVANVFTPSYISQDADGYTILDLETGEPVMRIDYSTLEAYYRDVTYEDSYEEPEMVLWFSGDGTAWSRQSMREAFGDSGWSQAVAIGGDRVIVVMQPSTDFYPQTEEEARSYTPPPTQVWVGTRP